MANPTRNSQAATSVRGARTLFLMEGNIMLESNGVVCLPSRWRQGSVARNSDLPGNTRLLYESTNSLLDHSCCNKAMLPEGYIYLVLMWTFSVGGSHASVSHGTLSCWYSWPARPQVRSSPTSVHIWPRILAASPHIWRVMIYSP